MSLEIKNLHVAVDNKPIIKQLNLTIQPGTIHALLGPNGSGKSTLGYTIMGHPAYQVTAGILQCNGQSLLDLPIEKRARLGIFLAFQHPYAIPGLKLLTLLKEMYTVRTGNVLSVHEFKAYVQPLMKELTLAESFLERDVHEGCSGGEKKKVEMLQLLVAQPQLAILDELDSGLDVDALKIVAHALTLCKKWNPYCSFLMITHYQRMLDYVQPDYVHVMQQGTIVETGDSVLAQTIQEQGYGAHE